MSMMVNGHNGQYSRWQNSERLRGFASRWTDRLMEIWNFVTKNHIMYITIFLFQKIEVHTGFIFSSEGDKKIIHYILFKCIWQDLKLWSKYSRQARLAPSQFTALVLVDTSESWLVLADQENLTVFILATRHHKSLDKNNLNVCIHKSLAIIGNVPQILSRYWLHICIKDCGNFKIMLIGKYSTNCLLYNLGILVWFLLSYRWIFCPWPKLSKWVPKTNFSAGGQHEVWKWDIRFR